MKLHELKRKRNLVEDRETEIVQFTHRNIDGSIVGITIQVNQLIVDWYDKCEFCPENGEYLLTLVYYADGKAYPVELREDNCTFESVMQAICCQDES